MTCRYKSALLRVDEVPSHLGLRMPTFFRRTAVRNLERSEGDFSEGVAKLAALYEARPNNLMLPSTTRFHEKGQSTVKGKVRPNWDEC